MQLYIPLELPVVAVDSDHHGLAGHLPRLLRQEGGPQALPAGGADRRPPAVEPQALKLQQRCGQPVVQPAHVQGLLQDRVREKSRD